MKIKLGKNDIEKIISKYYGISINDVSVSKGSNAELRVEPSKYKNFLDHISDEPTAQMREIYEEFNIFPKRKNKVDLGMGRPMS